MTGPGPHDTDAEARVLGALLDGHLPDAVADDVFATLEPDHFYAKGNRLTYEAIREVSRRDGVRDVVLVRAEMDRRGTLDGLKRGAVTLTDLLAEGADLAAPVLAERVVELAERRGAITAAQVVIDAARTEGADWRTPVGRLEDVSRATPRRRLEISDVADVTRRLAEGPPPEWLLGELWPLDAYGVIGAEDKAGKTFVLLDLAVSAATGTPWLGRFPTALVPVVAFLGEGGQRNTIRRLDAIVRGRDLTLGDLTGRLRLCFRVPHLTDPLDLAEVEEELQQRRPGLTILDPLYLAARGAKGSDLYAMGEALEGVQRICQEAASALAITTHWNKGGEGSGAQRFTGVGPGAWGRVLGSGAVEQRHVDPDGASTTTIRWEFTGGEIADTTFRMRRRVWVEDRADLASPMHYVAEVTEEGVDALPDDLSHSQRRVLAVLRAASGVQLDVRSIGDELAVDGKGNPLQERTIQKALSALAGRGLADGETEGEGRAGRWWAT